MKTDSAEGGGEFLAKQGVAGLTRAPALSPSLSSRFEVENKAGIADAATEV
jgi:hypothetical protein